MICARDVVASWPRVLPENCSRKLGLQLWPPLAQVPPGRRDLLGADLPLAPFGDGEESGFIMRAADELHRER